MSGHKLVWFPYARWRTSRTVKNHPARRVISKGKHFMGDVVSLLVGVVIFAVLMLYVPACEKV